MLEVHRAERAPELVDALAQVLAVPPADPFTPDLVAVPTRGVERWLTQRLSATLGAQPGAGDGICANVEFPSPRVLIDSALAAAAGFERDADPWAPERLVWPLIEVVEANLEAEWLAPLTDHLRSRMERRFARVQRIAALYTRYGSDRPELIRAWAAGDGDHWQAQLWRALRAAVGVPSPAERLPAACSALAADPALVELPARLALFGPTRLNRTQISVLGALAVGREVRLFLLHPSPSLWDWGITSNRLLRSWGREITGLRTVLGEASKDVHHGSTQPPRPTLLGQIQADIVAGVQPPGLPLPGQLDARIVLAADDNSVAIHACHGRARQVEVLREAILHRLEADPTLQPRDVIVMCPDVETFAPLIEASFADGRIPVRLADRALRQTNPILGLVARLLELPGGRVTASEVLDLVDSDPVRLRFGFSDDDLARIREWVADAAIHWGLDAAARVPFRLREEIEAGTWSAGLRRILLGTAVQGGGQELFAGVLPVADVPSDEIELAGRFAELVARLTAAVGRLAEPQPVAAWAAAVAESVDALAATSDRDVWQRGELDRLLADLVADASPALVDASSAGSDGRLGTAVSPNVHHFPGEAQLSLPEFRTLIGDSLAGRPTRANFRTGHLTVCTLMPMRSVPHRLVCLLGIDEGAFPRQARRDGDNLLLSDPQPGDRDPRAEDRQLLLDALMAAQEALVVTYSGHDERTGAYRPPAVPVGELLDAVDATARLADTPELPAREHVRVDHPLQPFDPRNFQLPQPWSFDQVALAGALAFAGERTPEAPFLPGPLPPATGEDSLALNDLVAFIQNPVRAFLRQRLELSLFQPDDELTDALPVELDQLGKWGVGQRLLDALLAGAQGRAVYLPEIARGTLPPGQLGAAVVREVLPTTKALADQAQRYIAGAQPRSFETNVSLPDGTRLTGTVAGVRGDVLLSVSYSRLNAQHRLSAWVRLLALTAAHPEIPFEALTVARNPNGWGGDVATVRIRALGSNPAERRARALAQLVLLAELRRRGLREPLPLPTRTAAVYAEARLRRTAPVAEALTAAEKPWLSTYDFRNRIDIKREDKADEHLLAFGGQLSLTALAEIAPAVDEAGGDWPDDEPSRFGRYAVRLWRPLLASETWD